MKLKKIHRTVLLVCGLIQSISGISCLVVGTLLNYDRTLENLDVSQARTYGSQNWLGLPLLLNGIILLVFVMIHRKIKIIHIVMMIFITFPCISLTLVGSILHGTSYAHFVSLDRQLSYFSDLGYDCQDKEDTKQCQCVKKGASSSQDNKLDFSILCGTQTKLLQFHGSLLSFAAISFGVLLGLLTMNIIFLFHMPNFQLPVNAVENQGFVRTEDPVPATSTMPVREAEVGGSRSEHNVTENEAHRTHEPPPPYESLVPVATFNMTGVMIGRNLTGNVPVRPREINHHATVRYRGEQNSGTNSFPRARVASPQSQMQQEITTSTERNNENNSEQSSGADETSPREEPTTTDEVTADDGLRRHEHQELDNSSLGSEVGIYLDISLSENHMNNSQTAIHLQGQTDSSQRNYIQTLSQRNPSQETTPDRINVTTSENTENVRLQTAVVEAESPQDSVTNNQDTEIEAEHQGSLQETRPQGSVISSRNQNIGNNTEHQISPQQRSLQESTNSDENANSDVEDRQSRSGQIPQVTSSMTGNVENIVHNGEQSSISQQTEYSSGSRANDQCERLQDNNNPASITSMSETQASHTSSTQASLSPPSTAGGSNVITAEPNTRETLPQPSLVSHQNLINIGDI